eukprot:1567043-Amphidinium_carterae.2
MSVGAPGLAAPPAAPSLLAPGRVAPPPGCASRPIASGAPLLTSPSSYQSALENARALLPPTGPPVRVPAPGVAVNVGPEPDTRGRGRASDQLVQVALQGGDPAHLGSALNLAMVEAIERLQKIGMHSTDDDEFDTLLSGTQVSAEETGIGGGAKGIQAMLRLSRAVERNPARWSQAVDDCAWRALGCDVSGQPWSMAAYGAQKIRFGRLTDHHRMWAMMASLHALHRAGNHPMVGARIGQCLKAIEASVALSGNWEMPWLYTGLPDPVSVGGLHRGLCSPGEVAAAAGFLRDIQTVESSLKKSGSASGAAASTDVPGDKDKKSNKPKGKGKDKEKTTPPASGA